MQKFRDKEECYNRCTHQIYAEHIEHITFVEHQEVPNVYTNVQHNEQEFESGKLDRTFAETQIAERQCLNSIQSHHCRHHKHKRMAVGIAKKIPDGIDESEHQCQEQHTKPYNHTNGCRENRVGVFAFLISKAKQRRFHAES